jgi:hypothetical protein
MTRTAPAALELYPRTDAQPQLNEALASTAVLNRNCEDQSTYWLL